ncbi:MAG: hypothetical protein QOF32_343 [Gammaproteobacteria bacterium]|jgi:hypothetical protein|nr:hypothetical protein [Gammaproteobacteria bacterium]
MAVHTSVESMLLESLAEYFAVAELAMERKDGISGEYGYPAAALLFIIASSIGSYFEKSEGVTIDIEGNKRTISNDSHHLYILNSDTYEQQSLTEARIKRVRDSFRGPLVHNGAIAFNVVALTRGRETDPVFRDAGSCEVVNLSAFLSLTSRAINRFRVDLTKVLAASKIAKTLYTRSK